MKEIVDWASTAWTVFGWLGLASALTAGTIAVGGPVWAVMIGVPLPIAIMVGFCVLVAGVYLAMAPTMYRALARSSALQVSVAEKIEPNYAAWRHVQSFTLHDAARLWCDQEPRSSLLDAKSAPWLEALMGAVRSGELALDPAVYDASNRNARLHPVRSTRVTRQALKAFAQNKGHDPRFLRDAE